MKMGEVGDDRNERSSEEDSAEYRTAVVGKTDWGMQKKNGVEQPLYRTS